jgi:UDP-N-acetylglucosamine:LPS N-acetylglucosamine transferase
MVNIVMCGGGTAGHVNPLLATAKKIVELSPDANIYVLGTSEGLEARLVPSAGFELITIPKAPFPRSVNLAAVKFPMKFLSALNISKRTLIEKKADILVGFGGYASTPAYIAANKLGIPIVLQEQNANPGLANKMGAKWASKIALTFENTKLQNKEAQVVTGLPMRKEIETLIKDIARAESLRNLAIEKFGLDPNLKTLLVTGGSLGSLIINDAIVSASGALTEKLQILHLTGNGKAERVVSAVGGVASVGAGAAGAGAEGGRGGASGSGSRSRAGVSGASRSDSSELSKTNRHHVFEYIDNMELAYAIADFAICRSGAGTVAEMTALGIPAAYIPLRIGNGEQKMNAQSSKDAGACIVIDEKDLSAELIVRDILPIVTNDEKLTEMKQSARKVARIDASEKLASIILTEIRGKNE